MTLMTAIKPPETASSTAEFSGTGTIHNPATGAVAGQVQWTDAADVATIAAQLRTTQCEWEQRGPDGRAKALARFAVWLRDHRGEIEELLIKETGKSAVDAAQEVPLLIMILSYYIKTMAKALEPEKRPAALPFMAIKKVTVHYRPRPVVGIIAPWNYPVANALMDGIGALAAGCSVLLKPSERTPLTAEVLRRGWLESGAPDVFAVVQGARAVSEAVIDNADYIQFTGSCATGSKVMERAARRLTPVSLELGGKDPMLVLEDVDVDHSMACMTEETFGPTLPIMKVDSVTEAVRLANDSEYGLSASVFSQDIDRAKDVALQLDCGAVNINDVITNLMCTTAPMGGWKTSGIGARFGGADGLRKFCRVETVVTPRTNVGAGGNYYHNSLKALQRMNKLMTRMALSRPRRAAK